MTSNYIADELIAYVGECLQQNVQSLSTLSPMTPYEQIVHNMLNKCIGYAVGQFVKKYPAWKRVLSPCITKCMFIFMKNYDKAWLNECVNECLGA